MISKGEKKMAGIVTEHAISYNNQYHKSQIPQD